MLFNVIVVSSFLVATALAWAEPTAYMMGMPSENNPFGIRKRQSGYQPTETACSPGTDCADSCGPGSVLCDDSGNPDPSFSFYCYNPGLGDTCCSDRSGSKYPLPDTSEASRTLANYVFLCEQIHAKQGSIVPKTLAKTHGAVRM
jgi:hypothetical protein